MIARTLITNLCLLAIFGSMNPQLNAASHARKNGHKHFSSSSSHHKHESTGKKSDCDKVHVINSLPAVIDRPGKWCVKEDLVFKGSGAAISIIADNVTLNFNNHSLTLNNPSAIGVYALNVQELTIQNDIIQSKDVSTNPQSAAFLLINCEKVVLDNIFTANTFFGIHAVNSNDVFVKHSRFKDHIGGGGTIDLISGGLRADGCSAVVVEKSTFSGAGKGLSENNRSSQAIFRDGSTACRISSCEFAGVEGAVFGFGVDGLLIEDCVTQTAARPASTTLEFLPAMQFGSGVIATSLQTSNVTVKNCLLNGNAVVDYSACRPNMLNLKSLNCSPIEGNPQIAIAVGQASMILIDNCEFGNFITNTTELTAEAGIININVAKSLARPHDITIRGCTIRGNIEFFGGDVPFYGQGILFANTDNVIIEQCSLIGIPDHAIRIGNTSTNVVIRDSIVDSSAACAIIFSSGIRDVTIANNHIVRTGFFNAIQVIDQGGNVIKNVLIEGNTISKPVQGIFIDNTENVVIRNNIIEGAATIFPDSSPRVALIVGNSSSAGPGAVNTTIQGNTISGATESGVQIAFATNTWVLDNTVNSNGQSGAGSGILVFSSTNTDLIGNNCSGNSEVGIGAVDCVNTTVQRNTISTSVANGLEIDFSTNTLVQDNITNYNGQNGVPAAGILVNGTTKTSLIGNTSIGNSEGGIEIFGGSKDTFVQNNTTTQNNVVGIADFDNTGEVTAFYNKSCDNGVNNCFNIPLMQAPGDIPVVGGNLCCKDPVTAKAKKGAEKANANGMNKLKDLPKQNEVNVVGESRPAAF